MEEPAPSPTLTLETPMIFALLLTRLLPSSALASPPKVDLDATGAVVTVRPGEGQRAGVLEGPTEVVVPLLKASNSNFYLIEAEAYRRAVAMGERAAIDAERLVACNDERTRVEKELRDEQALRFTAELDRAMVQSSYAKDMIRMRRSRLHWALGTGAAGLAVGLGLGVGAIVIP